MSIGSKLSLNVVSIFCLFGLVVILFQYHREKQYKIESLNTRLQDYNYNLIETLDSCDTLSLSEIERYLLSHPVSNLRVSLISLDGNVLYDNLQKNLRQMGNHLHRKEVLSAISDGQGYDIDRVSKTMGREYFYSATKDKKLGLIVRSALPYDHNLSKLLKIEQHYIWLALLMVAILSFVLYRFTNRLGKNISKLRIFATRAAANESLEVEDLTSFANDELGEIAERIIKLYKRLQTTKEEQNKLKRQLTQNIAHELKTPVASVQGYLETLLSHPEIDPQKQRLFLERSFAQTQRLGSLLQDISTLHKLDEGSSIFDFSSLDLVQTITSVIQETSLQLSDKHMSLVTDLPSSIPVTGNPSLLYSIFRNLIDNAICYAGEGTRVTILATESPKSWNFVFSDNGIGIAAVHLDRIFERFYRVDKGRSRKSGGTGLGLAIVKNAVLLHGGQIKAFSNENGGVRFEFSIRKNLDNR